MKYSYSSLIKPLIAILAIELAIVTHIFDRYLIFTSKFLTIGPFKQALINCSNEQLCIQDMQILIGMWIFMGVMIMACISKMSN